MADLKVFPFVAVRGVVPIPNNDFRIEVGRNKSLKALEDSENNFAKYVVLVVQKNHLIDDPKETDIYEYGVLATVSMKIKLPNNNYKVRFNLIKRVKIESYDFKDNLSRVFCEEVEQTFPNSEELQIISRKVFDSLIAKPNVINNSSMVIEKISAGSIAADVLSDVIAFNIKADTNYKYRFLEELDVYARLKNLLIYFNYQEQTEKIEEKIDEEVKKAMDEAQKEYILREKLKAIQNELGDRAKKEEEIEELRNKILAAKMPKQTEEAALSELARYAQSSSFMPESSVTKAYLDFLVSLPWHEMSKDRDDVNKVKEILDSNHYGLNQVKDKILEYLSVQIKNKKTPQAILCLAGPPGTGKTSLAISIAEALNRKFVKQSLGGVKDDSEIMGHRRTYVGALPGRILKGMSKAKVMNPVFLLDEIDKLSNSSYKGDPASSLLEVLDPDQNFRFSDHYLEEPYDLSNVLFITTANYLENIPEPLRDRMEIIELSSYTEQEKFNIAKKYLIKENLEAHGVKENEFSITDEAILSVIQYYTREAGVRELNRLIGTLIRKAVKKILAEKLKNVEVNNDNLVEFLGKKKFFHNLASDKNRIGVVTGLAYTQYGGDTLEIEVNYFKGRGVLSLTGKLGDVMKESAQIALSYIRSQAKKFNLDENLFTDYDFHIHVPEGAVPKDGPSAGVTLATSIYSALTNKYVKHDIGMTGEITLRGNVLPIGGLKEKSIAALRSGLNTIYIPYENEKDLDEVPEEVKKELKIVPIKHFEDLLDKVFI